ncbi:MAG: succinylglutamate-semialdehyde dehydrogenase [Verrucomicrobia bacterium]|nr:MAG: succinylglutamate-semialdehyde dehydrogenase [Verrucomicrobiota bacterium]
MTPSPHAFIDGAWQPAGGPAFTSTDPSTGRAIWTGRAATGDDIARATSAARRAFPAWARRPPAEREALLRAFAAQLEAHADVLAALISREVGKPRWEAATEVRSMIAKIDISIAAHRERCGEFTGGPAVTRFRPHGVVAVFGPFNFPGHLPNGHIVPALLAGNTVVFKPSEKAPAVAALTVALWEAAGLPPGCLNLVPGGRDTGIALAADPRLDGVFFTGSAAAGLALHRHFADRPDKILALEMGGNNPLVVWDVADIAAAVVLTIQSAFLSAGQRCTCARRLIITDGPAGDRFLAALTEAAGRIRVAGPETTPEPFMGPVIDAEAAASVLRALAGLRDRGGRILLEARPLAPGTGLLSPGLIDVTGVSDRPDEEIFGPLLQVIRVGDFEAAVAEANNTRYGLAAGLLSDDAALWERFRLEARAGIVNWNQQLTGASSAAPFGGIKLSGNHRPNAWFAADYCSYPVASIERRRLSLPETLPPGLPPFDHVHDA